MDTSGGDEPVKANSQTPVGGQAVGGAVSSVQGSAGAAGVAADDQVAAGQAVVQPKPTTAPPPAKPAAKEAEFISSTSSIGESESIPVVELKEPGELPTEVEGWIERAQQDDVAEPKTVVHQGQPVVLPAAPQQVEVTLPLDKEEIEKGLHYKLADSFRWLAEWCIRVFEKYRGKVGYKDK